MTRELKPIIEYEFAPDSERRLAMAFAIILEKIRQKNTRRRKKSLINIQDDVK